MKRILGVVLVVAVSIAAWSFDLTQIRYMQAQIPNSQAVVKLSSLDEFVDLVQAKEANVLYRVDSDTPRAMFAFVSNGSVYEVSNAGFATLVDFRAAKSMGLANGVELEIARLFGLSDRASVLYVNTQFYDSPESYRNAMRQGYKTSAAAFATLTMPESMDETSFTNIVLGQFVWYILVCKANEAPPFQMTQPGSGYARDYSDALGRTIADLLGKAGVSPQVAWTWSDYRQGVQKALASAPLKAWVTQRFFAYAVGNDGIVRANYRYPQGIDFLRILATLKSTRIAQGNQGPAAPTDSLVFAMATLSKAATVADYQALNETRTAGYSTVDDYKRAPAHGFENGASFYAAQKLGLSEYEDFRIVEAAGINDSASAGNYLTLFKELTRLKTAYGTQNANELTIAYALASLPVSVPYGLGGILNLLRTKEKSYLDDKTQTHDLFAFASVAVGGYRNQWSQARPSSGLNSYAETTPPVFTEVLAKALSELPWVRKIGTYNPETMVFVRR